MGSRQFVNGSRTVCGSQSDGPIGTTNYLYDGPNLLEEVDNSGNVLARYTQESRVDDPLSMLRAATTSYYQQDGTNSVTSLSDGAGAVAKTYTYDSFGKLTAATGTLTNPFQFTGREFDQETTIYFYRARYYDSSAGRFFSEDPIRFTGGPDFYVYVNNSPIGLIDPSGTDALSGDIQGLANLFPGSHLSPDGMSLTIPMSCKDLREKLLAQGYQDANFWGYNGPLSAFWNPFDHRGGWEWRTFGPGFHFTMLYDQPNPFRKCQNQSCTLTQFHIDPHNPLEGQTWDHVICDFLHWCGK